MRWPWKRKKNAVSEPSEAKRAHDRAIEAVNVEKTRWSEVKRISESLERARARNYFGESMIELFRQVQ